MAIVLIGWWRGRNNAGTPIFDPIAQMPASSYSAEEAVDFWLDRLFGTSIPPEERQDLVEFMAQGHNATYQLPIAQDEETVERLRAMIALALMTPNFQWR